MNRKIIVALCSFLLILSISACGGGGSDDSNSSSSANGCSSLNARIFGGESCSQEARSPVLLLAPVSFDGEIITQLGTCTAALVTVDDFITSAHCFINPIKQSPSLAGFAVVAGGVQGELLGIVNFAIHPFYNDTPGSRYDIAMGTLSKVPSPAIGPLPILISELTLPGSQITAFGYGTNDAGGVDELKAANFTIDALDRGNLFVVGDGENSICPGDSGGPAVYINSSGVTTIAGVNSYGRGDCSSSASRTFGFVDLQSADIINFIGNYAPDISAS